MERSHHGDVPRIALGHKVRAEGTILASARRYPGEQATDAPRPTVENLDVLPPPIACAHTHKRELGGNRDNKTRDILVPSMRETWNFAHQGEAVFRHAEGRIDSLVIPGGNEMDGVTVT